MRRVAARLRFSLLGVSLVLAALAAVVVIAGDVRRDPGTPWAPVESLYIAGRLDRGSPHEVFLTPPAIHTVVDVPLLPWRAGRVVTRVALAPLFTGPGMVTYHVDANGPLASFRSFGTVNEQASEVGIKRLSDTRVAVSISATEACAERLVHLVFEHVLDEGATLREGWGRYRALHSVRLDEVLQAGGSLSGQRMIGHAEWEERGRHCAAHRASWGAALSIEPRSRRASIVDARPPPASESAYEHWSLELTGPNLVTFTVEHAGVRTLTGLAGDLLFLALGALLGGSYVRSRQRGPLD